MLALGACANGQTTTASPTTTASTATPAGEDVGGDLGGAIGLTNERVRNRAGSEDAVDGGNASMTKRLAQSASSTTTTSGARSGRASGSEIRQWAISAEASSTYATDPKSGWSPAAATGRPDTPECGDQTTAWASATPDETAVLVVTFENAVVPTSIDIYETYNPGQIVEIAVRGPGHDEVVVYKGDPAPSDDCPQITTLTFDEPLFPVDTVVIVVDQSVVRSWAEIDAVELVGTL